MRSNIKAKLIYLGAIVLSIAGALSFAQPTYADSITDKSQAYALSRCANSGMLISPVYANYYYGASSVINIYNGTYYNVLGSENVSGTRDYADFFTCAEIAYKYENNIPASGATTAELDQFFTNLGYATTSDGSGERKQCAVYNFSNTSSGRTQTIQMCAEVDENGYVVDDNITITNKGTNGDSATSTVEAVELKVEAGSNLVNVDCNITYGLSGIGTGGCGVHYYNSQSFKEMAQAIMDDIQKAAANNGGVLGRYDLTPISSEVNTDASYDDLNKIYVADSINPSLVLSTLTEYGSTVALRLKPDEKRTLLNNYLYNYYGISYYLGSQDKACNPNDKDRASAEAAGYKPFMLSNTQECYIVAKDHQDDSVAAYDSDGYPDGTEFDFDTLLQELNALTPNEVDNQNAAKEQCRSKTVAALNTAQADYDHTTDANEKENAKKTLDAISAMNGVYWEEGADGSITCKIDSLNGNTTPSYTPSTSSNTNTSTNNTASSSGDDLTECLNNAGSLGWILCPALNIVKVTVEGFYDDIETNWLPVDKNEILSNDGEGIYEGWKVFRNFANIAFVIILTITILSQLTGVGLSNYSVKKILPSLIIVAVLVNVSFLICQLLVDVTNIVGAEAGQLLAWVGSLASGGTTSVGFGTVVKGAISTVFSFAGIGVAVTAAGGAIMENPALLLPILVFGLGLLISLFFFFAILALRKAGIFIMILVAPLAIICYALPNTKSLFDKWKKLFTSLLFVYPICQILVGGGQMISHIMLADNNQGFTYNVVAVMLSFLPIFLIPSIIRSSMTMLGNVGNRMQMIGNRFRNGTTGMIRKSNAYQRAQTELGYLGATKGTSLRESVNARMKKIPGLGGIMNKVEGKFGDSINNRRRRLRNQQIANYQKMMLGDHEANYLANNLDPEQALENKIESQEMKLRDQLIEDAMQTITAGKATYNGGTAINPNDSEEDGSMSEALDYYMDQYVHSGKESDLIWAQAIMRRMIETGDTTRTHAMQKLHNRSFDQNGNALGSVDNATSKLANYVSNNGQWMAKLKAEDNGSFSLINQLAQNGYATSNRTAINTAGSQSLRANQVGNLSDRYFNGMTDEIRESTFKDNYDAVNSLFRMDDVFAQAFANPQTASDIKPGELDKINELHKEAYLLRDYRAEQEADWAVQNSALMASDPRWEEQMRADLKAHPERYATSWTASGVNMSGYKDFDPKNLIVTH